MDLVNPFDCPEVACYRREVCGDLATVTYAWRGPLESLWRGVMIVRNGDDTTEYRSGPYTTPGLATVAAAALAQRHAGPRDDPDRLGEEAPAMPREPPPRAPSPADCWTTHQRNRTP